MMNLVAKNWWRDDHFRSLPGEESQTTLFVVEFQDGCRHFGYTRGSVFGRLSELIGGSFQEWIERFREGTGSADGVPSACVA